MNSKTGIVKFMRYISVMGAVLLGLLSLIGTGGSSSNHSGSYIPTWAKSYGGSGEDEASVVRETAGGGQIFAGTWNGQPLSGQMRESDIWVVKSDIFGDIEWQRRFGDHLLVPDGESSTHLSYYRGREANDGGAWLVGTHYTDYKTQKPGQEPVPHSSDLLVTRLSPAGQVQWVKTYDSGAYPGYNFFYQDDTAAETGRDIWPTADGGAIIAAEVDAMVLEDAHAITAVAVYVMKVNANGDTVWSRHITEDQFTIEVGNLYGDFDGRRDYGGIHVRETTDGGAVVATWAEIPDGDWVRVTKLDSSGMRLWTHSYGDGHYIAHIIQTDDDGDGQSNDGFMLVGKSSSNWWTNCCYGLILKLNADGTQDWSIKMDEELVFSSVTERSFTNQQGYAVRTYCAIGKGGRDVPVRTMRIYTVHPDGEVLNSVDVPGVDSVYLVRCLAGTDSYEVLTGVGDDLWVGTFDFTLSLTSQRTVASTLYESHWKGYPYTYSMAFTQGDDILEVSSLEEDEVVRRLAADGSVVWQQSMGSSDERVEKALDILETDDGYLIVGSSTSFATDDRDVPRLWFVKINGNVLHVEWQKTFQNVNAYIPFDARITDIVQQTSDGGYVFCGEVDGTARLFKLDADGEEEWISSPISGEYSLAGVLFAIQQMDNGNFVIIGQDVDEQGFLAMRDSAGGALSQYTYSGINPTSIRELDDGFIVGGFLEPGSYTPMAMKLDATGEVVWSKSYKVGETYAGYTVRIAPTSDGGFVLGTSGIDALSRTHYEAGQEPRAIISGRWNYQIMKLDGDGDVQWCRIYGGLYDEYLYDMQVLSDDTIAAAGVTKTMAYTSQAWVLKLGPDGIVDEGCNAYLAEDLPVWTQTVNVTRSQMTIPAPDPTVSLQVTDTIVTPSTPEDVEVARQCSGWANFDEGPDQGTEHTAPQFSYSPVSPNVGESISFDASASMNGEEIDTFEWDFDYDGTTFNSDSSGVLVTHTYNTAGSYRVRLRVTYNDGFQGETGELIQVTDTSTTAPNASFTMTPSPATTGQSVMYDASASTGQEGQNASISNYQWDFDGDGTWDVEGDGSTAKITYYVYGSADTYTVTLKITDAWGGEDETTQQLIVNAAAGDTDPPVWDGVIGIADAFSIPGTGELTVFWGSATDAQSPPVEYLLYIDSDDNPWDTTPLVLTPAGSPPFEYTFVDLSNGYWYVGVRCRDSATPPNVDDNDNWMEVLVN